MDSLLTLMSVIDYVTAEFDVFALALMAQFHPTVQNPGSAGSIWEGQFDQFWSK